MSKTDTEARQGPWGFVQHIPTRWLDNDQYGHLNNSAYYLIADSIVNTYLIKHCGLQPFQNQPPSSSASKSRAQGDDVIGLVISSSARYYAPTSFPATLKVGLRVLRLGTSSVTYQVGIHHDDAAAASAAAVVTEATHVFVDRHSRRPVKAMPALLRDGLERLLKSPPQPQSKL